MVANAGMIASLDRRIPLIADADTGFGGFVFILSLSSTRYVTLIIRHKDQSW
jgi:hypothetical protein